MRRGSIALSVEEEALGALGESLGDDLRVERVREHFRPVLEQAAGRDAGRATVVVAVGDDLEGKVGLRRVHGEDSEVVDDEEVGATVATEGSLELAVDLCAGEVIDHARGGGEDDAACGLAGPIGKRAGQEGLAGAGNADEEGVDAFGEEREIVKRQVASTEFLADGIEVEAVRKKLLSLIHISEPTRL